MSVKAGLPPIATADTRLFVLGSLPGDASLAAGRYYAHPTNQFWRLLGRAIGEELQSLAYDDRLERLAARGIGLWDVIASATRSGSLDQAIREAEHNRIAHLLHDFPNLAAIAFNGSTASAIGRRLVGVPPESLTLIDLPSSSAANTRSLAEKAKSWSRLAQFSAPAQIKGR
ncbi:MAG TPA: DNA-deoxyinosine glycosylase [Sphingomicrobium sp.]|nr:DNA-deoxyinosine glycosylase [Sphingomicrobium sp.]